MFVPIPHVQINLKILFSILIKSGKDFNEINLIVHRVWLTQVGGQETRVPKSVGLCGKVWRKS
jgi:hypothetical protein